jgi:pyruvate formate lyase activating enzyme
VNADSGHLDAIATLGRGFPRLAIDIMPYHDAGMGKYDDLGRPRPALDTHVPDPAEIAAWLDSLRRNGALQAALG